MWSMGLNPYDMYGPCYGGAPEQRVAKMGGLLRESEDEIVLAYPADISLDEEEVQEYEQVGETKFLTQKRCSFRLTIPLIRYHSLA